MDISHIFERVVYVLAKLFYTCGLFQLKKKAESHFFYMEYNKPFQLDLELKIGLQGESLNSVTRLKLDVLILSLNEF